MTQLSSCSRCCSRTLEPQQQQRLGQKRKTNAYYVLVHILVHVLVRILAHILVHILVRILVPRTHTRTRTRTHTRRTRITMTSTERGQATLRRCTYMYHNMCSVWGGGCNMSRNRKRNFKRRRRIRYAHKLVYLYITIQDNAQMQTNTYRKRASPQHCCLAS